MKSPRLMMSASMAVFGTIGLLVRNISVSSGELALYRALLALAFLLAVTLMGRRSLVARLPRKEWALLLVSGAAMGFNWILLFQAYRYTTVSVATLSYYFAPVLVTLACPLLFKEKMSARQWLCFGMSTVGLVMITGVGDTAAGSNHLLGIAFGLGAAVLYATVILLNKSIQGVQGLARTFWQFAAAAAVLVPYVAFTSGITLATMDAGGWACLLTVGLLHTGVTYCLYFSALKELSGQQTALLSYIDPLVAVAVSVTLLGETLTVWQALGGALILGFTLWNELKATQR